MESSDQTEGDPAAAFAALSDSTRVDIVRALLDRQRERPDDPALAFADLRKRVGVRDSGRFRYHLNELRDRFVEKTDGAYRLTEAGVEVGAAILAGTYNGRESIGPVELDSECPLCGTAAVGRYDDGRLRVTCGEDHALFEWPVPPSAAADASIDEVIDAATALVRRAVDLTETGTCPKCYADVETRILGPEHGATDSPILYGQCDACGGRLAAHAGFRLLIDPDVAAFYRRHGRSVRDEYVWELEFVRDDAVSVPDDEETAAAFALTLDGERLRIALDESAAVIETDRAESAD